jgi:type IV pilus assembly protein PilB
MQSHLTDLLVRRGRLSEGQLARVLAEQKRTGELVAATIVRLGTLDERELVECLQEEYGCPLADPAAATIPPDALGLVPAVIARRHQLIPMALSGNCLVLAMADPSNVGAINEVKFVTGRDVRIAVASLSSIAAALRRDYPSEDASGERAATTSRDIAPVASNGKSRVDEEGDLEGAPVVRLVHLLLARALQQGASDIHFEPFEQIFRIRYRIDGILREAMRPPWKLRHAVAARLKVMAGLDIAERRLPQDGRIRLEIGDGQRIDLRASVLPTIFGEKVVLRVLDRGSVSLNLETLGFDEHELETFRGAAACAHGMILVTGPTGSGKSTTLYATLAELNDVGRNICTAEDPVECNLNGVNQIHIHEEIGLTFSAVLRALLRQDPDVIMVGEIRDRDTAEIAIRAALTGHLVLSTLHTNDAPSTVVRLLDMGVEALLVGAALRLVVAQRLLRRLCRDCRQLEEVDPDFLRSAGADAIELAAARCFRSVGCERCHGSGYRGRLAVYEVMPVTRSLQRAIVDGASSDTLAACAVRDGMRTLRESALLRVIDGTTSLDEALRCTS